MFLRTQRSPRTVHFCAIIMIFVRHLVLSITHTHTQTPRLSTPNSQPPTLPRFFSLQRLMRRGRDGGGWGGGSLVMCTGAFNSAITKRIGRRDRRVKGGGKAKGAASLSFPRLSPSSSSSSSFSSCEIFVFLLHREKHYFFFDIFLSSFITVSPPPTPSPSPIFSFRLLSLERGMKEEERERGGGGGRTRWDQAKASTHPPFPAPSPSLPPPNPQPP